MIVIVIQSSGLVHLRHILFYSVFFEIKPNWNYRESFMHCNSTYLHIQNGLVAQHDGNDVYGFNSNEVTQGKASSL